jgi:transcriptional regulator with XRE-family HTH domain
MHPGKQRQLLSLGDSRACTLRKYRAHGTLCVNFAAGGRTGVDETRTAGPTVLRMILGRQLAALRQKAGLSLDEAAAEIFTSPATVRRMESADGALKPLNVQSLLLAYGITDPREIETFLALARDASRPGWWHSYDDVLPSWFRVLLGLEEAATLVRGYEPHSVPGLLQTPGYARASVRTGFPDAPDEEVTRRAELRIARQHILTRPHPPRLWLILDETALRRPAATTGPDVMAAARPNVTLQVLPFSAGLHPAMFGPFKLYRFDEGTGQPDIVYCESMTSALYIDKPDETAAYIQALDRISAQAAPAAETQKILNKIRKEL